LPDSVYLQMGWIEFMHALASRLVEEHRADLAKACNELIASAHLYNENVDGLCERISKLGLLNLGRIRAQWMLAQTSYIPRRGIDTRYPADLLLVIGLMERVSDSEAIFRPEGTVEFHRGNSVVAVVMVAHGQGYMYWTTIEERIKKSKPYREHVNLRCIKAIVSGARGKNPKDIAPPENIIPQSGRENLIPQQNRLNTYNTDELRTHPEIIIKEIFA
jgi:hypothetical protein